MKKKLSLFIIMLSLLLLVGCFDVAQVKSVTFTKAPKAEYSLGEKVDASQFEVQIVTSNETLTFDLTNSNITVQGLIDGKLDTATPGTKSVTVTYQGVSATVYYIVIVTETPVVDKKWTDELDDVEDKPTLIMEGVYGVATAKQLAYISANSATYATATIKLTANIDLSGKLWVPIPTFGGTFDGQNFTISNMTTLNEADGIGLFKNLTGGSVSNLTIENPVTGAYGYKEVAVLAGTKTSATQLTIGSVTIVNANAKGLNAVGGLIGRIKEGGTVTIENSYVQGRFSTNNPVLSTFGDGEGDKVGGLVGQNDNKKADSKLVVSGNTVNVIIEGTRDLGGLVGWTRAAEYNNNVVLAGTEVKANVAGGVRFEVGTRNVGALVGTVALQNGNISFTNNTVAENVVLFVDTVYEPYSSTGVVFGGVRRNINDPTYHVIVNTVVLDNNDSLSSKHNVDFTYAEALDALALFANQQTAYLAQISEILVG